MINHRLCWLTTDIFIDIHRSKFAEAVEFPNPSLAQLQRPNRRANGPAGTGSRDGSLTPAMRAPLGAVFYCQSSNLRHIYRENEQLKHVKRQSVMGIGLGSKFTNMIRYPAW